jgi:hypothetical protein
MLAAKRPSLVGKTVLVAPDGLCGTVCKYDESTQKVTIVKTGGGSLRHLVPRARIILWPRDAQDRQSPRAVSARERTPPAPRSSLRAKRGRLDSASGSTDGMLLEHEDNGGSDADSANEDAGAPVARQLFDGGVSDDDVGEEKHDGPYRDQTRNFLLENLRRVAEHCDKHVLARIGPEQRAELERAIAGLAAVSP